MGTNTKILLGLIVVLALSVWYSMLRGERFMSPPELTLASSGKGSVRQVAFISWTASEKASFSEKSLRARFKKTAKIKAGINYLHVSNALAGTILENAKKYIDPKAENILIFVVRSGKFVGEKAGPYNPRNIQTDIEGVTLRAGDGVIVIAHKDSFAFGFLGDIEPAEDIAPLEEGWNLVAITAHEAETLPEASENKKLSVWVRTRGAPLGGGTFKNAKTIYKKSAADGDARAKNPTLRHHIAWVNNKQTSPKKDDEKSKEKEKSLVDRLAKFNPFTPPPPTPGHSRAIPLPFSIPRPAPLPLAQPPPRRPPPAPPTLTLKVEVINNNGRSATKSDFPLFLNMRRVTSDIPMTLEMGVYNARATAIAGYSASGWKGDCKSGGTVTLINGETKTCTVTMDDTALTAPAPMAPTSPSPSPAPQSGASPPAAVIAPAQPGPAATSADLTDIRITQSGLVTRSLPTLPLVAGKATLIRGTVVIPSPQGALVTRADLDVVRSDTGRAVHTVQGFGFASDNITLTESIGNGEDVHFFIPGDFVNETARYKFIYKLKSGRNFFMKTALENIQFQKNDGLAIAFLSLDQGLPADAPTVLRVVTTETARIFPVKSGSGGLLPATAAKSVGPGIRYEYIEKVPVPTPPNTDFEREFLLRDMKVGVGPNASGSRCAADVQSETWSGPFFALNTTYPEDTNRNGTFDEEELARCRIEGEPASSSMLRRFVNFARFMITQIAQKKSSVASDRRYETIPYGMVLVSGRPSGQNRSSQIFGNTRWATLDATTTVSRELLHILNIFPEGEASEHLQGPAYNLELKRRISHPMNLLGSGRQQLPDAFLSDSDYDAVQEAILP